MTLWLVRASWAEDEAEVSERWHVNAPTAQDAIREVLHRVRFPARNLDVRVAQADVPEDHALPVGEAQRLPPGYPERKA